MADLVNREFTVPANEQLGRIRAVFDKETAEVRATLKGIAERVATIRKDLDQTLQSAEGQLSSKKIALPAMASSDEQADLSVPGTGTALGDLRRSSGSGQHISQAERLLESAKETVRSVLDKTKPPKNVAWPDDEGLGCVFGIVLLVVGGLGAAAGGFPGFLFAALIGYGVSMALRSLIPSRTLEGGYRDVHQYITNARSHLSRALAASEAEAKEPLAQADARCRQALQDLHARLLPLANSLSEQLNGFAMATSFAGASWSDARWQDWMPSNTAEFGAAFGRIESNTNLIAGAFPTLPLPFEMPALLPFSEGRGLLLLAHGVHREHAVNAVQSLLARLLATIPPGKLRMTFFDPVSLGGHVAAFMPLADHEETLINSRAWTEPRHIEERLAEITEHMETVIQKYLRTDFRTIHDYNAAAGEVAEPFRFVVVFDFPVNFTDTSARRLVSIARNGARCGVYVIIVRDPSKPLPYGFEVAELEQHCEIIEPAGSTTATATPSVVEQNVTVGAVYVGRVVSVKEFGAFIELLPGKEGLCHISEIAESRVNKTEDLLAVGDSVRVKCIGIDDKGRIKLSRRAALNLSDEDATTYAPPASPQSRRAEGSFFVWKSHPYGELWRLRCDPAPAQEVLSTIIARTGELAQEGMRVEVPFEKLLQMASIEQPRWSETSTARAIEVPLGPTGARRTQQLTLGLGTAHHGLIVGRTGSGKSNLMHVMITALAWKYSPNEIQLYLIDFKKGVEFQPYATALLPHALAIAVESEREFALSVIERLDEEMSLRDPQFKSAGVNNIVAFREAKPDVIMPRVLLLIDEFQELFREEDALSRKAAQLLNKIVLQGRSFGIHVILGTQTLKRAMDLTSATFDQMAVRIALQCSDADSRLILADDNPAARLLSRPGEAIYNNSAGLLEGNNLFQVARFEDRDRPQWLETIRGLAVAAANGQDVPEPIVFEGRQDADLPRCRPLVDSLRRDTWPTGTKGIDLYLGEPIAIRPPVAARLRRQSGSNLLIITRNENEGVGMAVSSAASLLLALPPGGVRLGLINFATADDPSAAFAPLLAELFPDRVSVCSRQRDVAGMLDQIALLARGRSEGAAASETFVLFLIGLHRVKALRENAEDEDGLRPVEALRTILKEGPEGGVHTIAWCDTWPNARTHLDDRLHGEFSQRVGGIMNGDDSRWFLDDEAAARLDDHRCLYYDEDRPGQLVKFRPYALPDQEWLRLIHETSLKRK